MENMTVDEIRATIANTPDGEVVAAILAIEAHVKTEEAKHKEALAAYVTRSSLFREEMLRRMIASGQTSVSAGGGRVTLRKTAIYKAGDEIAFQEFLLESGDLSFATLKPRGERVKEYLQDEGILPPGVLEESNTTIVVTKKA